MTCRIRFFNEDEVKTMLPLGSIVLLERGEEKLMIIGRKPIVENINHENVYLDYMACRYPVGMAEDEVYFFNDEDIEEVIFYRICRSGRSTASTFYKRLGTTDTVKKRTSKRRVFN
ncbi:DUF4176 domain-containing protein [Bacillus aquiflavi]|uniref:DUF4176 domain-containing protein n=1 Tax=Bacillus aquiflavi TaxID=2672567 RepID=UPI001CA83B32|nr:DUF4176 domain-containing protein [Bacillus aquiflavi]UAC47353.1 DUF4176 domain-containing protein [Bacillus aquiflavi]